MLLSGHFSDESGTGLIGAIKPVKSPEFQGIDLRHFILYAADKPKPGIVKCQFRPLLDDRQIRATYYEPIIDKITELQPTHLVCLTGDARSIGANLEDRTGIETIGVSKKDEKMGDHPIFETSYDMAYASGKVLCAYKGTIPAGARVVIVDDDMESGGTIAAAKELVDRAGAQTVGVTVLSAQHHRFREKHLKVLDGIPIHSTVRFDSGDEMRSFAAENYMGRLLQHRHSTGNSRAFMQLHFNN